MSSYYEKLLATGELKCVDEEIPFEIPQGWEWCRICHVAEIARGGSPRPIKEYLTDATDGVNWIKIGDTEKDSKYITSVKEKIKLSGVSKSRMVHKGDFLLTNSMSFGRPYITQVDGCIHDGWLVISLIEQSYTQDFFYYLLSSGYAYSQFASRVAGAVVQNLNSEKVAISLFPLPPYKEQKRIVKKIEELLPLVEKFGYNKSLLDKLNAGLYSRIKKSILQEAIQGKLVPQITEEGTARELLDLIKIEKQKLIKEGKLKKSVLNDSVIFRGDDNRYCEKIGKKIVCIEDEVPFEIPNSWVWARLGTIVDFSKSQTISSSMLDMDSWILDLEDIEKDSGRLLQKKRMKDLLSKSDKHLFYKGNVLYSKLRPYLNKVIVADEDGACTTEILAFDFGHIYNKYAQAYLMSPFFVDYANSDSYGIKMPRLGSKRGNNALFPLPPFKEQQRIVAQIEKLFEQLH
ncbi:restriction endonuclease subunit S [Segatella copri]|uniref:restriction endonuclease subunit S n=1 Tax=Segatella copri TaxID=165179 RepID=UPI00294B32C8|nr:restriction endonuclease subunit S [Segatella copri]WOF86869.1 restriction endonuclease subunit S [Segatella copri]WOF93121.1 restriction endonuclease subunit S [Segatella copri]